MTSVIEVKDVCKTYFMAGGTSQVVLKHINFAINSGEFVAIMGHSGSGKSTLMNILGCLDRPTSGEYLLEEQNVANLSDSEMARIRGKRIGFVFQNFNLLMKRTLVDNVSLPLIYQNVSAADRREKAFKLLEHVGLKGYEERLPTQISGGMQQRVAIARSLVNDPAIIFADEPTGNLDTRTSNEIMDLFTDLNKQGITIVLVTHEEDIADYAKRLIMIVDGQIQYDGPREEYKP